MIKYFRELLDVLKSIDASLKVIAKCVGGEKRSKSYLRVFQDINV